MKSSVRNRLEGEVAEVILSRAMSQIDVKTFAGIVTSVVTTRPMDEPGLKVGNRVTARMKATAILVGRS